MTYIVFKAPLNSNQPTNHGVGPNMNKGFRLANSARGI